MVAIITTQPTINLKPIHDGMPVILEPDAEELWLHPEVTDPKELTPLLHPYVALVLQHYAILLRHRHRDAEAAYMENCATAINARHT